MKLPTTTRQADDEVLFMNLYKRIPKLIWVCLAVILIGNFIYQHQLQKAEEHLNNVKKLYQDKNDFAFLTFVEQTSSFIPLAETLEAISTVNDKDTSTVIKLINKAKKQSEEWEQQIMLLVEFSDDYSKNADPQLMINNSVMTSVKQEETFLLTFRASINRTLYNISWWYSKSKPKMIDQQTRDTLMAMAKEVRAQEVILGQLKESAAFATLHEGYEENVKMQLLDRLAPHLQKLNTMQDELNKTKHNK